MKPYRLVAALGSGVPYLISFLGPLPKTSHSQKNACILFGLPGYFQSPVLQAPEDVAAGELSHEDALRRAIFRLSGLQVFIHGLGV